VARVRADFPIPDTLFTDILFSPDNCFLAGRWPKGLPQTRLFLCLGSQGRCPDPLGRSRFLWPTGRAFSPDAHFVAYIKERHIVIYNCWISRCRLFWILLLARPIRKLARKSVPEIDENILLQSLGWKVALLLCDEHGSLRAWDTQDWSVPAHLHPFGNDQDLTPCTSDDFDGSVLVNAVDDSGMEELMASLSYPFQEPRSC